MLCDSVVVVIMGTRPRAIPLAMITMRKSTHGFPFVSHIWVAYGALLGGPSGRFEISYAFGGDQRCHSRSVSLQVRPLFY